VTLEEPQANYGHPDPTCRGSSAQEGDISPGRAGEWVADLFRPAVYGESWTPSVRITMWLVALAVIAIVMFALVLVLRQ
jgi:hypothetical protein